MPSQLSRRRLLSAFAATPLAVLPSAAAAAADPRVTIRKVEAIPIRIPYRDTFIIGRGLVAAKGQAGGTYIYVRIETTDGRVGWGETIALPSWSYETVESIVSTIRNYLGPIITGRSPFDQAYFQARFDDVLTPAISQGFPFAKAAVQIATYDLAAQLANVPLHALLGGKVRDTISICFALSIDTPAAMAEAAQAYPDIKAYKLKVAGTPELDAERVRAVAAARSNIDIWLDANQAYRPMDLESFLKRIDGLPRVRCLEQPVKSIDWLGMRRARHHSSLPLAADEGCFSSQDVARLARLEACDLIVLKVAKSGGLLGCQRSAAVAEANGLGLLGSGLAESGVGFAASIHLFSTLDLLLPPELNGPKFLSTMLVDGLTINGSTVTVPDGPGLGIKVDEKALRAHAI